MKVFATMCMMPDRYPASLECVMSLKGQVEKIYLCLNGFEDIPEDLNEEWIEVVHFGQNLGDAARFFMLPEIDGHLISCDDDLVYPEHTSKTFWLSGILPLMMCCMTSDRIFSCSLYSLAMVFKSMQLVGQC